MATYTPPLRYGVFDEDLFEVWYLALCQDCEPLAPQPFVAPDPRDAWAERHHEATHHTVKRLLEVRVR